MPRYALIIEYDGSQFAGWQNQLGRQTIQGEVENALTIALRQTSVTVVGSGRTDSGVHARFQVAHFDASLEIDPRKLFKNLNGLLPETIAVKNVIQVSDSFHARFDAWRRVYNYYVTTIPTAMERHFRVWLPTPVDFGLMNQSCRILIGEHDYNSFCLTQSEVKNRICTVQDMKWVHESGPNWHLEIAANRFLHGMVRTIVGTLLKVGSGKIDPASMKDILDAKDRTKAGPAAKPGGLVLELVQYPDGFLPYEK